MGCVSAEWSSAPCTAAEGELLIHLGLLDMERDLINWDAALEIEPPPLLSPSSLLVPCNPPSSLIPLSSPEGASVPPSLKNPPSHPLLPPPLLSGSPSARPQPTIYAVRARWHCHTARSPWSEFPSTPPPASKAQTPPRPVDPSTTPWVLAPSSPPWPSGLPGSLFPPALP